jgi:hypothetical protein
VSADQRPKSCTIDTASRDMYGAAELPVLAHHVLVVAAARRLVGEGAQDG